MDLHIPHVCGAGCLLPACFYEASMKLYQDSFIETFIATFIEKRLSPSCLLQKRPTETNPTYLVSTGVSDMACFSKKYGDEPNPSEGFGAVMTCSSADRGCPLVYGADARFAIPYVDPKVSDGTAAEAATYDARLEQIGTEMLYLMGQVAARVTR